MAARVVSRSASIVSCLGRGWFSASATPSVNSSFSNACPIQREKVWRRACASTGLAPQAPIRCWNLPHVVGYSCTASVPGVVPETLREVPVDALVPVPHVVTPTALHGEGSARPTRGVRGPRVLGRRLLRLAAPRLQDGNEQEAAIATSCLAASQPVVRPASRGPERTAHRHGGAAAGAVTVRWWCERVKVLPPGPDAGSRTCW